MAEIRCPACGHSLAFHSYEDDGCQAPLGGLTNHPKCGCPLTLHVYIQGLQKQIASPEIEKLKEEKKLLKEGTCTLNNLLNISNLANDYLKSKIKAVQEILNEAKLIDSGPFYGHFKINYKKKMQELLDKALLELEKTDE